MDNRVKISNLDDLIRERQRLRLLARGQEGYLTHQYVLLRKKVSAPVRAVNNLLSYIPGVSTIQALFTAKTGQSNTVIGKIVNVLIPLLANRFLPRKTGMMTRGIFSLLTKQVTALLTSGKLADIITQLTNTLKKPAKAKQSPLKRRHKKGPAKTQDFGIPPDSETY